MKPVKPVVWALLGIFSVYLAVAAASAYKEGSNIFVWMGRFSEVLKRPSLLRWTPYTVKCIVIVLLLCAFAVLLYRSDREKRRPGGEYGTAKWEAAETMNQKYADKDGPNVILTQHVSIGMDGYKHQRNLNVLVVGGSGSGKTRYFCKPGLMDASCSYLVVDHNGKEVLGYIKEKNKTLTDIDAVVIDKKTGEIALFQLKWQDPADYSPFTLKSKRSNYYSAAEKWLEIIEKWLSNSADEDIASKLGVKVKYFDKKKISIFVLGRRRGNYSGNGPYPYECAWSQWYQIMYAASYLRQENEFTISNLYKLIVSTSPFNIKISEKPVTFCYGKYRIKFGGKTFCGKDTR